MSGDIARVTSPLRLEDGRFAFDVADGWQHGPREDRGDRWPVSEVGPAVRRLLEKSPEQVKPYGS